jgi:hypothetical protein
VGIACVLGEKYKINTKLLNKKSCILLLMCRICLSHRYVTLHKVCGKEMAKISALIDAQMGRGWQHPP